ncbi:porin [Burkholderia lata]|uniref:porin n=1 Tax=Burkholderia lata (strain ATCC 17760 / DSM 23089 / LMG 22485 / NCIMB 9086 / R18194 / 383) TaxID=482957 RepID=UPI0014541283|nr:porin [Burkholderia lata]VWC65547.1 porin [Burkholderia lata]
MKRGILLGVALSWAAFAHAQSSVLVWGRLGGDVQYTSNVQTANGGAGARWAEGSDWGVNILGFKGAEDLGHGNHAMFLLESAFTPTGSLVAGLIFQRAAWVALKNDRLGTIRFGQGPMVNNYVWEFDPLLEENFGAQSFVAYRNGSRLSNGIRYLSPELHGFSFEAELNLGNSSVNFNSGDPNNAGKAGRADGFAAAYTNGDFQVRVLWDEIRNAQGKEDNLFRYSREAFVGIRNRYGPFQVQAAYTHYSAPDTPAGLSDSADLWWAGLSYDVNPALHVHGAVYTMRVGPGRWTDDHDGAARTTMLGVGCMYNLSKRTFLYSMAAHVFNSAQGNFGVNPQNPGRGPGGAGWGTNPPPGQGQSGLYAGVETLF